jgi:hypothetical protein
MTTTLTFRGRLPGVACDPALPVVDQPVRLDVAGFVGYAERGPLNLPVPVEDMTQYAAIFGGDLALAQDDGKPVYAQLPTAVRAFFDNGGRRCYVVRVAGKHATAARFQVPGLQLWPAHGARKSAVVDAAWEGGWSEGVSVDTTLSRRLLRPSAGYTKRVGKADGVLHLRRGETLRVQPGDLLRLDLGPGHPRLFARVHRVDTAKSRLLIDQERAFAGGEAGVPITPEPGQLTALPTTVPTVVSVELLRFDLVVRQHTDSGARVLDRYTDLAFDSSSTPGGRPAWSDVLQPLAPASPDQTRSLVLRQNAASMQALDNHLAVPAAMPEPSAPLDLDAPIPAPLVSGSDDLDTFDPSRFVDGDLKGDTTFSLIAHADQLTWLSSSPRQLNGMHALLGVDEVALVAVPDAGQRGWTPVPTPPTDPAPPLPVVPPLDWSDFRCCADEPPLPLPVDPPPSPTEADLLPALDPVSDYLEDPLLAVQLALVTMCAARADQVGLLSVPRHYDMPAAIGWQAGLANNPLVSDASSAGASPLSFAGFWHPWVSVATGNSGTRAALRDIPPDGIVAGMIAARELARGAWIAPAGTPLSGVVRLADAVADADMVSLFNAHANLLVQHPGTFSALSAHTLSGNPQQLQVSIRRLLILLRKIALLLGAHYTFEVNNERFRQLVRMRFDRILGALVDRGALHAFRVVTDSSVNTFADQDAGRFIVVLQIAPTNPIEFITVTLVRSGEGLLEVLEG